MRVGVARACANLALVKYWGKKDERLVLPLSPSLSLTLKDLQTTTRFTSVEDPEKKEVRIDGKKVDSSRVSEYLQTLFKVFDYHGGYLIESENSFPARAGLASSSSGFCALAGAFVSAMEKDLKPEEISRLSRLGSGSACRSVFKGFSEWNVGDDETSIAKPIESPLERTISVICCLVDSKPKAASSREGMRIAKTSPLYEAFITECFEDFEKTKKAVIDGDLETLGTVAEKNTEAMNRVNSTSTPQLNYLEPLSQKLQERIKELRSEGLPCWFTNDAGPNLFVITDRDHEATIDRRLKEEIAGLRTIVTSSGPGLEVIHG